MFSSIKIILSALAFASVTLSQDSAASLSATDSVADPAQASTTGTPEHRHEHNGTMIAYSGNHTHHEHNNATFGVERHRNGTHHRHGNHTGTFTGVRPSRTRGAMSDSVSTVPLATDGTASDDGTAVTVTAEARRFLRRATLKRRQDADTASSMPPVPSGSGIPSGPRNGTFLHRPHNGTDRPFDGHGRNATVEIGHAGHHNGTHFGPPPMGGNGTLPSAPNPPSAPDSPSPPSDPATASVIASTSTDAPQPSAIASDAASALSERAYAPRANTRGRKRATCQR